MAEIWCVASAKGGVGKTFVSTGLGVGLSQLRKKVLIVDFDLTGACVHTIFGQQQSKKNVSAMLNSDISLNDLVSKTNFNNLDYIAGFSMPQMNHELELLKLDQFITKLKESTYDIVLLDLGCSHLQTNLQIMSMTDKNFLITNSEVSSIEKTYRLVDHMVESKTLPANLMFLVNFCRSQQQQQLGLAIESVIYKKHKIHTFCAGTIQYDNAVWQSSYSPVSHMQNVFALMPYSVVCHDFYKICKQFIDPREVRAVS